MKITKPLSALLDANVLYPAPLRDFLLHLAAVGLFEPKWTLNIHEEWMENLLLKRPDLQRTNLEKTVLAMERAFPLAAISNFENLIDRLSLPDPDDRHLLAAAIKANVTVIVTFNIKDFPETTLNQFGIRALHPDLFISNLFEIDKQRCLKAFENQLLSLRNPPKSKQEVLDYLKKCGLKNAIKLLE